MAGDKKKLKHASIVINNPRFEDHENLTSLPLNYMIVANEIGDSGTPHLQAYIQFKSQCRFSSIRNTLNNRAHIEPVRGTPQQNVNYVKKGDQPKTEWKAEGIRGQAYGLNADCYEFSPENFNSNIGSQRSGSQAGGEANRQRFEDSKYLAKNDRIEEIPGDIYIRFYETLKRIRDDAKSLPQTLDCLDNYWIYGFTGVGKSMGVRKIWPNHYPKMKNKWFDGYKGEPTVIIDEWARETGQYLAEHLRIWADYYPFTAETKGSSKRIRPTRIVVISNWPIEDCFRADEVDSMKRRFTTIHVASFDSTSNSFIPSHLSFSINN